MEVSNLKAIVTGAASGIGRTIALNFARGGAQVMAFAPTGDAIALLRQYQRPVKLSKRGGKEKRYIEVELEDRRRLELGGGRIGPIDADVVALEDADGDVTFNKDMWHANANSHPPPRAYPPTAATTGLGKRSMARNTC